MLVNNVGGFWATRHLTADGLEHTVALNHLGPFLLTNLLLDPLTACAAARIVMVSSGAQALGKIDFGDLQGERAYSGQRAYHQSKLANVMFTTPIYLASSPEVEGVTGRYFANRRPKKSSKSSCDTRRGGPALGAQRRPGRPARHDLTPA